RSLVGLAWWTDRLGRKHLRIVGGHGPNLTVRLRIDEGPRRSSLEQIYPEAVARVAQGGVVRLVALRDRRQVGERAALGWRGTRCGPCHDRAEAGEKPVPPLWFRPTREACVSLAFAPDGRSLTGLGAFGSVWRFDLATGDLRLLAKAGEHACYVHF